MMKPDHIKEAIPSLGLRIRFENLYSKFLSGLDEVIVLENVNEKTEVLLDAMDGEDSVDIDNILDTFPSPDKSEVKFAGPSNEITPTRLRNAEVFNFVFVNDFLILTEGFF